MRQLEPFSYFAEHASAISGFGGGELAPDPRYCFHTHYEELCPGRVVFHLRMIGARASEGELTLRVHGYKVGSNSDVSLVAGTKRLLQGLGTDNQGETVELSVSIAALKGVQYALYGFFSEPSDLQVDDVVVSIDECGTINPAIMSEWRSKPRFAVSGIEAPGRLYSDTSPLLRFPVSQDCTLEQLDVAYSPNDKLAFDRWRTRVALAALDSYGMLQESATGAIIGAMSSGLTEALHKQGCRTVEWSEPSALKTARQGAFVAATEGVDFVLSYVLNEPIAGPSERYRIIRETVSFLMSGGLAVFVTRYYEPSRGPSDNDFPSRNEIGQWALRLIGLGHDVAQLAFGSDSQRLVLRDGSTPFVLIVRCG